MTALNPSTRDLGRFAGWDELWTYLGARDERKLANNTYVVRVDHEHIGIVLHRTRIVMFSQDGAITLNSGGYMTVTTKARINQFIRPFGWSLAQRKHEWWVEGHGEKYRFYDGMVISAGPPPRGNPRPRRTARRMRLLKTMGFFRSHAGGVVGQAAKGALSLARAEKYARDHGWDIDLAPEQERYEDVYGEPDPGGEWVTVILRDRHSKVLGSLGFVDASDKNYLRVVAAELAAEAMP